MGDNVGVERETLKSRLQIALALYSNKRCRFCKSNQHMSMSCDRLAVALTNLGNMFARHQRTTRKQVYVFYSIVDYECLYVG